MKADEFQNGYWLWKYYSDIAGMYLPITGDLPLFVAGVTYFCEMTEKHPEYAKFSRKPAIAGEKLNLFILLKVQIILGGWG